jgi:phosphoglycolate phosphatase
MHDAIVFDLDGTLWDTCAACAIAWNDILKRLNIPYRTIQADDVRRVTGKPHAECVQLTFPDLPESTVNELIELTAIEDAMAIERVGGELYPGVNDGLVRLQEQYRLFIVSNCQSGYIEMFLKLTGFEPIFEGFECWGNTSEPKSENLRRVIERHQLNNPIMIGDTEGDQKAAIDCGVPFGFVSYGFQSCRGADVEFTSFTELVEYFLPS